MSSAQNGFFQKIINRIRQFLDSYTAKVSAQVSANGYLPGGLQLFVGFSLWFISFFTMSVFLPYYLLWLRAFIPVILTFTVLISANEITRRVYGYEKKEEDVDDDFSEVIDEAEFGVFNLSSLEGEYILKHEKYPFVCFLLHAKKSFSFIPAYVVSIISINDENASIFANLSTETMQLMSDFDFAVVDQSNYESLILQDKEQTKLKKLFIKNFHSIIHNFNSKAKVAIEELKRENRAEFGELSEEELVKLFPSYPNVHVVRKEEKEEMQENVIKVDEHINKVVDEISQDLEQEHFKKEDQSKENKKLKQKKKLTREQEERKKMMKNFLLYELQFSFDNFVNAARIYYKKAIETQLEITYEMKEHAFMKTLQLFCEKNQLPFFYQSYKKLVKFIEFIELEQPDSEEIELFIDDLIYDCLTVELDKKTRVSVKEFIDSRLHEKDSPSIKSANGKEVSATSIPRPSVKELQAMIEGGN